MAEEPEQIGGDSLFRIVALKNFDNIEVKDPAIVEMNRLLVNIGLEDKDLLDDVDHYATEKRRDKYLNRILSK